MATPLADAGDARSPDEGLDLFISHCSKDQIAKRLYDLIRNEIYAGDEAEPRNECFSAAMARAAFE